jgi:hypothetical protein
VEGGGGGARPAQSGAPLLKAGRYPEDRVVASKSAAAFAASNVSALPPTIRTLAALSAFCPLRLTSHVGTLSSVKISSMKSPTSAQTAGLGQRGGSGFQSISAIHSPPSIGVGLRLSLAQAGPQPKASRERVERTRGSSPVSSPPAFILSARFAPAAVREPPHPAPRSARPQSGFDHGVPKNKSVAISTSDRQKLPRIGERAPRAKNSLVGSDSYYRT